MVSAHLVMLHWLMFVYVLCVVYVRELLAVNIGWSNTAIFDGDAVQFANGNQVPQRLIFYLLVRLQVSVRYRR